MDDDTVQDEIELLLTQIEQLLAEVRTRVAIKPKGENGDGDE